MAGFVPPILTGQMKTCIELARMMFYKLTARSLVLELPDGDVNGEAEGPIMVLEAIGCELGQ